MALPACPDPDDPGMPRWVRAFVLAAGLLVLVFLAVHLAGGGFRHHLP
jgi:hypothetical protein